jgi:hypothetical protein
MARLPFRSIQRAQSGVQVVGDEEAMEYLKFLAEAHKRAAEIPVSVGSNLEYAYGIETGRHRGGRLARRAGGVFYLTRAYQFVRSSLAKRIAGALEEGPDAVEKELMAIGHDIERAAKGYVVRITGTLQRSITAVFGGRAARGGEIATFVGGRVGSSRPTSRVRRPR